MTGFKLGQKSTVTFMLTDVEGSTRLWERHPSEMREALVIHDAIGESSILAAGGELIKSRGEGDSLFGVFHSAPAALSASLDFQRRLQTQDWPKHAEIKVRVAIHTGEAEFRETDFYGATVNRCARLRAIAHGRQVLLSEASAVLCREHMPDGVSLLDLGERRLKDLQRPERVYQLSHPEICNEFPPLLSLDEIPNNLPVQVTSFVGRAADVEEVRGHLRKARLISLIGAGGSGKTRLSLQIGADLLEEFPDGVWFVELAPIADQALVPRAVAQALHLADDTSTPTEQQLISRFGDQKSLLILDNCEHVLDAASKLSSSLLTSCPHLKILISSREALGVAGELIYRVRSLQVPQVQANFSPTEAMDYGSVQLFVDRASFAKPDFELTDRNLESVTEVCRRLDGIPLAIELAAARVTALPVDQIAERLADRFRLLTGGSRSAMPRQQTLRALIDWSYELLNEPERLLLSRLSVFSGGMTLEAAEAVCSDNELDQLDVLDVISHLVEKSLLNYVDTSQTPRYRFLETVRQYAIEKLIGTGHASTWHDRHLDYFLSLAEQSEPGLRGPDQMDILAALDADTDNFRTALDWAIVASLEKALRLAGALSRFWMLRGHLNEGRSRLVELLSASKGLEISAGRARALNGAGILCWRQGDMDEAGGYFEAALGEWEALEDRPMIASALNNIGLVRTNQGDFMAASELHEKALAIRQEIHDEPGVATSLHNIGLLHWTQGNYVEARDYFERCLVLRRKLGDANGITDLLNNLGATAMREGNFDSAQERYEECLDLYRNAGNRSGVAIVLHNLADIYCRQGRFDSAEPLARESLDIAGELSIKALLGPAHLALGLCAEARSSSEAIADLRLSCQNAAEESDVETALDSLKELAICQADIGDIRRAEECLKLAEELENHVGAGYRPIRTETARKVAETLGMTLPPMASRESTSTLKDVLSLTQTA